MLPYLKHLHEWWSTSPPRACVPQENSLATLLCVSINRWSFFSLKNNKLRLTKPVRLQVIYSAKGNSECVNLTSAAWMC